MRWPFQRRSEHHVSPWTDDLMDVHFARCCCGWIGAPNANPLASHGQWRWSRHAGHYRRTDGPCTRTETP